MQPHDLSRSLRLSACPLLAAGIAHANVLLDQDGDALRELTDVQPAVEALPFLGHGRRGPRQFAPSLLAPQADARSEGAS